MITQVVDSGEGSLRNQAVAFWTHLGVASTRDSVADKDRFVALMGETRRFVDPHTLADTLGMTVAEAVACLERGDLAPDMEPLMVIDGIRVVLQQQYVRT